MMYNAQKNSQWLPTYKMGDTMGVLKEIVQFK